MIEHVLLIHGLAENAQWMSVIESSLRLQKFHTTSLDYPSTSARMEELSDIYIRPAIRSLRGAERLHIVAHSMGCILVRYILEQQEIPNLGRIVMIAPGNEGSPTMRALKQHPLFPMLMGPAGIQSADDEECFACTLMEPLQQDIGVIAGCIPLDPVSWFVMREPNDGKITVESTKFLGMRDHIIIPASHDTLLAHPLTAYQVSHYLRNGRFDPYLQGTGNPTDTLIAIPSMPKPDEFAQTG